MALMDITDAEELIAKVRQVIVRPQNDNSNQFEIVYSAFFGSVNRVNKALQYCVKKSRDGLPSEALQRAESEMLLELATILDLADAEYECLFEMGLQLSLPPAVRIDSESAASINELFAPQERLKSLLKQQRRLALSRAPLRERLVIMRRILKEQPDNSLVTTDIKTCERVRHAELINEVKAAVAAKDRSALSLLLQELCAENWLVRPEKRVVDAARKVEREWLRNEAAVRVSELNRLLHSAWLAKDLPSGKKVLASWNKAWELAGLNEDHAYFTESSENRIWVEEHVTREAAVDSFNHSLETAVALFENLRWRTQWKKHRADVERVRQQLDRTVGQLQDLGTDIPEDRFNSYRLAQRQLTDRIAQIRGIEQRRRVYSLSGITAAVIILLTSTYFGADYFRHRQELQEKIVALQRLVDGNDIEGADAFVQSLSSKLRRESRIAELIGRHDQNVKNAEDRKNRFRMLHGGLLEDIARETRLTGFDKLEGELNKFEQTATDDAERSLVLEVKRLLADKRRTLLAAADKKFAEELAELRVQIPLIRAGDIDGLSKLNQRIAQLAKNPNVSPEGRVPAELLEKATSSQLIDWLSDREEKRILESIRASIGDWGRYRETLQKYVDQLPQRARSEEFRKILRDDATVWACIEPWNQILREIKVTNFTAISPRAARDFSKRLIQISTDYPLHPAAKAVNSLVQYLESIAVREDSSGMKLEAPLAQLLEAQMLSRLYMVLTKDGKRYYCNARPEQQKNFVSFNYFKSGDMSETSKKLLSADQIVIPEDLKDGWISPQSVFARELRDALERLTTENWETEFVRLLVLLHRDKTMDPILKCQLIQQILPIVERGSPPPS